MASEQVIEIYTPTEVEDQAISTLIEASGQDSNKSYTTEVFKPVTQVDKSHPSAVVATELLSQTLDTRSKKIKGQYTFSKLGAIKVGEYVFGVSGEVTISPDGIVALDVNGDTTVLIDSTTGDVYIKGTLQAGSVIAGATNVGNSAVLIDGANARIVINDSTTNRIVIGEV